MNDKQFERLYNSLVKIAQETERLTGYGVLIAFGIHDHDEAETKEGAYTMSKLKWPEAAKLYTGIGGLISEYYGNGKPWEVDVDDVD